MTLDVLMRLLKYLEWNIIKETKFTHQTKNFDVNLFRLVVGHILHLQKSELKDSYTLWSTAAAQIVDLSNSNFICCSLRLNQL